jgi:carboxyl-terminal processing protease
MKTLKLFLFPLNIRLLASALLLGALAFSFHQHVGAQSLSSYERQRGQEMLRVVKSDLQKHYYDPAFHGIDLEANYKKAEEMVKQAKSNGQIFGIIASMLIDLNDSHTFFMPPSRAARIEYGWRMQMIGDRCYVVDIKPGSDAEAKGLKVGDAIHFVDDMKPTREDFWKIQYLLYSLRPQSGMHVVAETLGGQPRELDILANVREGHRITDLTNYTEYMKLRLEEDNESRLNPHRFLEMNDDLIIWKMPRFDLPKEKVNDMMDKVRNHKALILDLRGNGGGAEETLLSLIGNLFEQDVKVGDLTRRKEVKPLMAKSVGSRAFKGKIVVLVDSQSGSCSELLARVVQIEKRGLVIGDRTAGAVMRARHIPHEVGIDTVAFYALSVTDGDLTMTDGKSLERLGVTPDELLLPTSTDMAARRDPVLSRAADSLGIKLEPEKAGAIFPVEWRK